MKRWKFQLRPSRPGSLAKGYRMDSVGVSVEREVNEAVPFPLRFHGIQKLVLVLGGNPEGELSHSEEFNVAVMLVPSFPVAEYALAADAEKQALLRTAIESSFDWLLTNFDDADFARVARERLGWGA